MEQISKIAIIRTDTSDVRCENIESGEEFIIYQKPKLVRSDVYLGSTIYQKPTLVRSDAYQKPTLLTNVNFIANKEEEEEEDSYAEISPIQSDEDTYIDTNDDGPLNMPIEFIGA